MIERKRDREIVREIERDRAILRYRENVSFKQRCSSKVATKIVDHSGANAKNVPVKKTGSDSPWLDRMVFQIVQS